MLKKNIRSGAKGCNNDKTKRKKEDGEKMEERGKKKGKTKWSSNQSTIRGFTPQMQVLEAPENKGALDRYRCVLVFVLSDEETLNPSPTSFLLFLLGFQAHKVQ
jgi:hypothetical protein